VLVSLDSFLHRHVSAETTPRLHGLGVSGGFASAGGRCDLPSVTYPSHASLLSGRHVGNHGVLTGRAGSPEAGVIPGWAGETNVARLTMFDLCRTNGLRSAAILGDHKLFQILNAGTADSVWPPSPDVPPGIEIDLFGYATNAAIHEMAIAAVAANTNDFVFIHYNETDTAGHLYGPDAPETLASYRGVDKLVGEIADVLESDWSRTVLIVVSDHGMELIPEGDPINLLVQGGVGEIASASIDEAGVSLLRLRDGVDSFSAIGVMTSIPGVVAATAFADGVLLVEAEPGRYFGDGPPRKSIKAGHGGRSTTETLAIVAGGHPSVRQIARAIEAAPPHLVDWAPTIAGILGFDMGEVDGIDRANAARSGLAASSNPLSAGPFLPF